MTAKLLTVKGNTIHRSKYRALTREEIDDPKEKDQRSTFDQKLEAVLGSSMSPDDIPEDETPEYDRYEDHKNSPIQVEDRDDIDQNAIDMYRHAEVSLPIAGEILIGKVVQRKQDSDGNLIGKAARNPILDTRSYIVSFPDGREAEYSANVIAENMLAMCDDEGNQYLLMKCIIDHKKEHTALEKEDAFFGIGDGNIPRKAQSVLRWIVELGRIDIITEVSSLASCLALPRRGIWMLYFTCMPISRRNKMERFS
jgi:hypothetical protein